MENSDLQAQQEMLQTLTIKGFKSIRELDNFELKKLNIVVGANGSGKSNLISFFKLLRDLMEGNLGRFVRDSGGANALFFQGRKGTKKMEFETMFGVRGYRFKLVANTKDECSIEDEARYYRAGYTGWWYLGDSADGSSLLVKEIKNKSSDSKYSLPVYNSILSWQIYHFHDTGSSAGMRSYEIVEDDKHLRPDAANLAPFLLKLKNNHSVEYNAIINAIRLVAPFFENFILEPRQIGARNEVNVSWKQKGSDYPFQPYHLSDGTIRFICLVSALLQPNPPSLIIIDEPEMGLHPAALHVLAELVEVAATKTQLIVATQSPEFINHFRIGDVIVVNRENSASTFHRLSESDYSEWMESYSIGELWVKNVIAGGPKNE